MPADTALAVQDRGHSLQGPPHRLSDPAVPASGAACPSRWQLATDAHLGTTDAATCWDDGLAGLLSLLLSQRLVRHDQTDHAGLGCAHLASESRTHEAVRQQRLRYERRWASLLLWLSGTITPVSPVAVAFNGKAFLSSESGASALDARTNPMSVGPQLATAGFAEPSCILLAQASRVHLLAGSGAKVGCCLSEYGATSVASGLSGGG